MGQVEKVLAIGKGGRLDMGHHTVLLEKNLDTLLCQFIPDRVPGPGGERQAWLDHGHLRTSDSGLTPP